MSIGSVIGYCIASFIGGAFFGIILICCLIASRDERE